MISTSEQIPISSDSPTAIGPNPASDSSMPTSTPGDERNQSNLSLSDSIALGVGIGVGVPTVVVTFLAWWFPRYRNRRPPQ